jgi:hypothetical protein
VLTRQAVAAAALQRTYATYALFCAVLTLRWAVLVWYALLKL